MCTVVLDHFLRVESESQAFLDDLLTAASITVT